MQGYPGAQALVTLPDAATLGGRVAAAAGAAFTTLEVELSFGCPTPWEVSCAIWDRQAQVLASCSAAGCNVSDPTCGGVNTELARFITPFRRGLGHWVTDVTPLLPLLFGDQQQQQQQAPALQCLFTAATDSWALPWTVSMKLHLSSTAAADAPTARALVPLWNTGSGGNGGANWGITFDKDYAGIRREGAGHTCRHSNN